MRSLISALSLCLALLLYPVAPASAGPLGGAGQVKAVAGEPAVQNVHRRRHGHRYGYGVPAYGYGYYSYRPRYYYAPYAYYYAPPAYYYGYAYAPRYRYYKRTYRGCCDDWDDDWDD